MALDFTDKTFEVISLGHRNPQGLFVDHLENVILETEHDPQGGDEINIIPLVNDSDIVPNYGWPIASTGDHYGGRVIWNEERYKKYPLEKSHKELGFIEPSISFTPSIGISQITKIDKSHYVVATLKTKELLVLSLEESTELKVKKRINIGERIRDIHANAPPYI